MTFSEFQRSLEKTSVPAELDVLLSALWYDGKGDWARAHEIIQDVDGPQSFRIHAYLHRKEGDIFNADYWYQKAYRIRPEYSFSDEWEAIVRELLDNNRLP